MTKKKQKCPHCKLRFAPAREDFCGVCRNWMNDADQTPVTLTMPRWAWQTFEIILETLTQTNQTDPSIQREIRHALDSVTEAKK
jgi:hypothetical protein